MNIIQGNIAMDISMMAFETAVAAIRGLPDKVTLYCTQSCCCTAFKIKEAYRCEVILVPDELAKSIFHWGVIGNNSMYWNTGV